MGYQSEFYSHSSAYPLHGQPYFGDNLPQPYTTWIQEYELEAANGFRPLHDPLEDPSVLDLLLYSLDKLPNDTLGFV